MTANFAASTPGPDPVKQLSAMQDQNRDPDQANIDPAIVVEQVSKSFGTTTAVDGISFNAGRAQVLTLLGPNGAGKTTTIEMCEGFTKPSSGQIRVLGVDPSTHPDRVRRRIGIMLQGGGAYSGIRVGEMLRLAASYSDHPHDPDWLLDVVGLRSSRRTTYRRLSGGQQQRLSLALALINRPEVIFLDEPTAGMDAQSRNLVWELIRSLRRDGVTVILTTHLMDEAESLADRVMIMDHGRILADGTPEELTRAHDAGSEIVSIDTAEVLDLDSANRFLKDRGHLARITANNPLSYSVSYPATPTLLSHIASAIGDQNVLIRKLDVDHRTLEDVFLDITGREMRS